MQLKSLPAVNLKIQVMRTCMSHRQGQGSMAITTSRKAYSSLESSGQAQAHNGTRVCFTRGHNAKVSGGYMLLGYHYSPLCKDRRCLNQPAQVECLHLTRLCGFVLAVHFVSCRHVILICYKSMCHAGAALQSSLPFRMYQPLVFSFLASPSRKTKTLKEVLPTLLCCPFVDKTTYKRFYIQSSAVGMLKCRNFSHLTRQNTIRLPQIFTH